jgi:hypothetical protein
MARELKPEWMERALQKFPMSIDKEGNLVTCPVFLDFVGDLTKARPQKNEDGSPKLDKQGKQVFQFGTQIIFPAGTDFTVPKKIVADLYVKNKAVREIDEDTGKPTGNWIGHKPWPSPFRKQEDIGLDKDTGKMKRGYTRGALGIRVSTRNKPLLVEIVKEHGVAKKKVLEEVTYDKLYSGVVAICTLNPYYYAKGPRYLAGVGFGVTHVVLINTNTPMFFEGGAKKRTLDDIKDIDISADDVVNFETGDGHLDDDDFGDDFNGGGFSGDFDRDGAAF